MTGYKSFRRSKCYAHKARTIADTLFSDKCDLATFTEYLVTKDVFNVSNHYEKLIPICMNCKQTLPCFNDPKEARCRCTLGGLYVPRTAIEYKYGHDEVMYRQVWSTYNAVAGDYATPQATQGRLRLQTNEILGNV